MAKAKSKIKLTPATITSCLRYHNAPAAITWLCKAFGFKKHAVYADKDGSIMHAQLTYGNGMIMLSSTKKDEYGKLVGVPRDLKRTLNTQTVCVIVADADKHYKQAKKSGAKMVWDIEDQHYGGRSYICRDPEGYLWCFGTYNPWEDA